MEEIFTTDEEKIEKYPTKQMGVPDEKEENLKKSKSPDKKESSNREIKYNIEKEQFTCDKCGVSVKSKRKLGDYIRYHHLDPTNCHVCSKSFPSKRKAVEHIAEVHTSTKGSHLCTMCPRAYNRLGNLKRHQKSCHSEGTSLRKDVVRFTCQICSKTFSKAKYLNSHVKTRHQVIL